jgi:hypothetical protein
MQIDQLIELRNGKQNHQCKACGRQFVNDSHHIKQEKRELIKRMLLERISLRGICRVVNVSLRWLLDFITSIYEELPDDLNVATAKVPTQAGAGSAIGSRSR